MLNEIIYFHGFKHSVSVKPLVDDSNGYVWASDGAKIDLSLYRGIFWWFSSKGYLFINYLFTYTQTKV